MADRQCALVTGASRGIGRAIAEALAGRGVRVAVHYHRNKSAAEGVLRKLRGEGHILLQADLGRVAEARGLCEEAVSAFGHLDILVNNAGLFEFHPPATSDFNTWLQAWELTINTNLNGPATLAFCAVRPMIARGGGRIVNISSRGAFRGEPDAPAYGASKAGLNSFSQSMAKALAPHNIGVFAIAPGWVDTDMATPYLEAEGDAIRAQSPLNRLATPQEIASAAVYLSLDAPMAMTGAIIDVNCASYLRT